ncbi:alanine/glycine:cation symporter family protein [Peptostreptococcus anaerobius]|uniref:alanine/glycine:cation symporter family protein n=1 Tax=Peptostreptococcus anaerobius TaxID=1261 RepID=UPI00321A0757
MYYPILIVVLAVAGIYFSFKTGFIQLRLFRESLRAVMEKPDQKGQVSSFQALMVSTASRVGTGNIVGVSTAIVLGGPGAAFWMWVLAIVGSATAFIESTLAQIYKRRDKETGGCYGGPAYYIESALKNKTLASLFVVCLILTYGLGFNLLCSYNLQSTFSIYSFYNPKTTPMIIGAIIAIAVFISIVGGGKRMIRVTEVIVPFMGVAYIIVSLIVVIMNIGMFPEVIKLIFTDAFSGRSFAGGLAGSCLIYGIKRGLYSNEAGVGSAPNAAASAEVSHPVKQGLVQVLSVYIDTIVICSATAFMILVSGIPMKEELAGAPMVQESLRSVFGSFGPLFITIAMIMFAFTTLIGNLYYCETGLSYLNGNKKPGKTFMIGFYVVAAIIVFVGATMEMDAAWASADITMGLMALINIPCCVIMGGVAIKAAKDYEKQRKAGQEPVFHSKVVGLDSKDLDYWE